MKLSPALLALPLLLAVPRFARAQGNYRSTPTGGRSALLGDTGIALGSDGSSPFLNPATIVRIHDASLAFSVNFLSVTQTHFSNWHQPGGVDGSRFGALSLNDTSVSTTRFDALPSTLCLFFTIAGWGDPEDAKIAPPARFAIAPRSGRQKLAACVGTTEQDDLTLPAVNFRAGVPGGTTHAAQSATQTWRRVHVGPSYGVDLNEHVTLGASLHAVFTSYGFVWSSGAITADSGGQPISSGLDAAGNGRSIDLDPILGVTVRAGRLTFGLTGKPPAAHLYGTYDASFHQQASFPGGTSASLTTASGEFSARPPARVGLGVGADLGALKLEVDGTYFFALEAARRSSVHVDTTTVTNGASVASASDLVFASRARPVLDLAVGAEYFVSPDLSILGGASTDISSIKDLAPAGVGTLEQAKMNRFGLSGGIGSYGDAGTLLIGFRLGLGIGQSLAVNPYVLPNEYAIVDTQSYSAMLILAGSTSVRALRGAIESVEEVVSKKRGDEKKP